MGSFYKGFQAKLMSRFTIRSINSYGMEFQLEVFKEICNNYGILHGGAVSLICQELSLYTVKYHEGIKDLKTGSINLSFLAASREKEVLNIYSKYAATSASTYSSEIFIKSANNTTKAIAFHTIYKNN